MSNALSKPFKKCVCNNSFSKYENMAEKDLIVLGLKSLIVAMSMEWQREALGSFNHTIGHQ